jgi:hypothetical protein
MRLNKTIWLGAAMALSAMFASPLPAQARSQEIFGLDAGQTPVLEAGFGYTYLHANAPPAQCGCFSANGGYGSAVFHLPHGLAVVADLSAVHASNLSGTTQTITVFHYLFGPRYSFRALHARYVPYAQALGGGSQESSNYAAVQQIRGAAFSVGGGVSMRVARHISYTLVEADWVGSRLANGQNNLQNDLRVSTGIAFRLGPR